MVIPLALPGHFQLKVIWVILIVERLLRHHQAQCILIAEWGVSLAEEEISTLNNLALKLKSSQ